MNKRISLNGSEAEVQELARYALQHGMPGRGYICSTSNCIYTGMPLSKYELMLDVWREEGNYQRSVDRASRLSVEAVSRPTLTNKHEMKGWVQIGGLDMGWQEHRALLDHRSLVWSFA